jgi:hypothetical protein
MSSLLLYRRRSRSSTRNYVERETSGPWSSSLSSSKQWQDQQAHWRCKSQTGSGSETWSKLAEWTHEVTALLQQCTGSTQHHAHPTATVQRPSIQLRPHTRSTTGGVQVAVVTWHDSLVCSVTKEVNGRETEWTQHNTTQHNTTQHHTTQHNRRENRITQVQAWTWLTGNPTVGKCYAHSQAFHVKQGLKMRHYAVGPDFLLNI